MLGKKRRVEVVENEGYRQVNEFDGDRLIRSETHYKKPIEMPLKFMPEEPQRLLFVAQEE